MTAKTGADVISSPLPPETPARHEGRKKWLRLVGAAFLAGSLALMIVPVSYRWGNLGGDGRTDCGVPLQALFRPPAEGCGNKAIRRSETSIAVAGVGVLLIAFSGVRRRLLFLGLVLAGSSVYPMLVATNTRGFDIKDGKQVYWNYQCGSALGDLARRGYFEVQWFGASYQIGKPCGDMAVHRLYLTLGMAGAGLLLIGGEAIRHRATVGRRQ